MRERQRNLDIRPEGGADADGEDPATHDEYRRIAESLLGQTERSLSRLGLSDVNAFLNATRQSGGQ
jgi:hypothetical protein